MAPKRKQTKGRRTSDDDDSDDSISQDAIAAGISASLASPQDDPQKADNGVKDLDEEHDSEDASASNDDDKQEKKRFKLSGPENAGTLLFCGGTNWDLIGRRDPPKTAKKSTGRNLWGPNRLAALQGIRVRYVASGNAACHSVLVTEDGQCMSWGRNDKGQLGQGDLIRRDDPTVIETLKNEIIVSAAAGRSHTLFIDERGDVFSCGDNKMGQCGIGSQNPAVNVPTRISFKRRPIVKVSCGGEFSMMVDFKGNLFSFGCPEYGQLGHNTDGRYFVSGNKLSFQCELTPRRVSFFIEKSKDAVVQHFENVVVTDIGCGINHTIIVDDKKRCFTWGFGGYGRLGHADPKDEMVPRLVKAFDRANQGVKSCCAGSTFCCIIDIHGSMYFWGQNKKSGEATMYPKPVQDLASWHIKEIGTSSRSIVIVADEGCASWGSSPTYGELGYGENKPKSSSVPQEIKLLDGFNILKVSCGSGHTLFIAQDDEEDLKKKIQKLPEYSSKA